MGEDVPPLLKVKCTLSHLKDFYIDKDTFITKGI